MLKRVFYSLLLLVFLLSGACATLRPDPKNRQTQTTLSPEFFKNSKRIAIQDFNFAEGVETNAFSPVDSSFLRTVIESKIVEQSGLEVIMRKDEGLLTQEMAYKFGKTSQAEGDNPAQATDLNKKLGVDAFVYGIIYEYDYNETRKTYSITVAIKIVATENGRIWQSRIVNVSGEKSKHQLFNKLAASVAQNLRAPKMKKQIGRPKGPIPTKNK